MGKPVKRNLHNNRRNSFSKNHAQEILNRIKILKQNIIRWSYRSPFNFIHQIIHEHLNSRCNK